MSNTAPPRLKVSAREPFTIYYEGDANVVSGSNKVGRFDILPGHADFFSVMTAGDVVIQTEENTISFPITNGIITVRNNDVKIFVNM